MRFQTLFALCLLVSVGCSTRDEADAGPRPDGALLDGHAADGGLPDLTTSLDMPPELDLGADLGDDLGDDAAVDMTVPMDMPPPVDLGPPPPDFDGDGVPDATDNCITTPNTDQMDMDADGHGDACDPCPADANPGMASCPGTIYQIKTHVIGVGSSVALANALVTAVGSDGFVLQVKETDPGYAGAPNSGIFVSTGATGAGVVVGDRVDVDATVNSSLGQLRLVGATVTVVSSLGEAPPLPTDASAAEVATGGTRATELEAVIVHLTGTVAVTDVNPPPSAGDIAPTNELVVESSLRVDDHLYLVAPFPLLGETFTSLTGVLLRRNSDSKLEPRDTTDVVFGPPVLVGLGPALSYQYVGTAGPTTPVPLTVQLTRAATVDTDVMLAAGDASVTVLPVVTVMAGSSTAVVPVTAVTASTTPTTITATLGTRMLTAQVRALDPAVPPVLVSLTPAPAMTIASGTVTLTVTLDVPAPAGGTAVTLSLAPPTAATVPASVTVPAGATTATFDVVDLAMAMSYDVTATLGAAMQTSHVVVVPPSAGPLLINEVDYDQPTPPTADSAEYVEIYNPGVTPRTLAGVTLYLLNGASSPAAVYSTFDLSSSGVVPPGGYLVVAPTAVTLPAGAVRFTPATATNILQNGPNDGIALVDTATGMLLDAFSYEGGIMMATVPGLGVISLVHGTASTLRDSNTVTESLCREPSGTTSGDDMTDWVVCTTLTPGAANP